MAISQANKNALKNPWALGIMAFIAFFLCSNAVFIYLAFQSAPNLVVNNYYERGEQYQQMQEAIERQEALGWQATVLLPTKIHLNTTQTFEFIIQDNNLAALAMDSVVLHAYRPSDASADFQHPMIKHALGHYQADIEFPLIGSWDLIIQARKGEDEFLLTKRIHITH